MAQAPAAAEEGAVLLQPGQQTSVWTVDSASPASAGSAGTGSCSPPAVCWAITNTGGDAPNVVQAEAESVYLIRAPKGK